MLDDDTETTRDAAYEGRALVAAFAGRENAREAARQLHDEGFHHIWIGVTRIANTPGSEHVVQTESESIGERIGRFFSGDMGDRSLSDELARHGVDPREARRIDASLQADSAILTVDGANHPELAAQIIEELDGHVLAGEAFDMMDDDEDDLAVARAVDGDDSGLRRGSDVLGYRDPNRFARGQEIDEERRVALRSERLNVAKERVAAGEATIGKEVVETPRSLDVATIREELFVERREPSGTAAADMSDADAIGEGETIRIPLMREEVRVTKRPVVTAEYVVGKRAVEETQHVEDTTREERIVVNDGNARPTDSSRSDASRSDSSRTDSSRTTMNR